MRSRTVHWLCLQPSLGRIDNQLMFQMLTDKVHEIVRSTMMNVQTNGLECGRDSGMTKRQLVVSLMETAQSTLSGRYDRRYPHSVDSRNK